MLKCIYGIDAHYYGNKVRTYLQDSTTKIAYNMDWYQSYSEQGTSTSNRWCQTVALYTVHMFSRFTESKILVESTTVFQTEARSTPLYSF